MADTRKGWSEVVTPDDLDAHMIATGQVAANARLVSEMFREAGLPRRSRVYVPGAGTGQLFEFIPHEVFAGYDFLFTDLRAEFLDRIAARMPQETYFRCQVDDVEDSWIDTGADIAVVVLLLEHVMWRVALDEILETQPSQVFVVIQRNEVAGSGAVTLQRELRPSIREFARVAKSELVPSQTLVDEMLSKGYALASSASEPVPDSKVMLGLRFVRRV